MEANRRRDLCPLAGGGHQRTLMPSPPRLTICLHEHRGMSGPAGADLGEELRALFSQYGMTGSARLARPDRERPGIGVEVVHLQRHYLAEPCAGLKRGLHEQAEIGITRIDQALRFGDGEVSNASGVDVLEGPDPRPRRIRWHLTFAPCVVERGLQDGQRAIRRRFSPPLSVSAIE